MSGVRQAAIAAASAAAGAGAALLYTSTAQPRQPQPIKPEPTLEIIPPDSPGITPIPDIRTKSLPIQAPPPGLMITSSIFPNVKPEDIRNYGHPGPVADELKGLSLYGAYDRRTRNPLWVAEHITRESVAQINATRKNNFREDLSIPKIFRAKVSDYVKCGYDRGHQVPAQDAIWSQKAIDDTFKMSNMCPQVGKGFNSGYWRHFEDFCRNLTSTYPSVRIVTGPLYLPRQGDDGKWRVSYEVIGSKDVPGAEEISEREDHNFAPNVAVPTHFFKIIYGEKEPIDEDGNECSTGEVALGAFVLPNAVIENNKKLADFEVDVAHIERASGLEFVKKLDPKRQTRLCEEVECGYLVKQMNDKMKSKL
ncbi:DNA/RNA non-specific endonuclease [Aspergillus parasiticus SU-1]|uniref:DNA/RNA non-specific endonuclease n=1 Tax=Aspergillus parasiticus (strain ATCC 56775 / NRRL 5862 / SRRC 143 / SU-1) TaxID=1403190 RepID=A0A0F0IDP0_ASPPU|nr:DNA/RNA non-specific endonuclease [Aspergillus parasiticus SU-1]